MCDIEFKKSAPADEHVDRPKTPINNNSERAQNDEREIVNPERQDAGPAQVDGQKD